MSQSFENHMKEAFAAFMSETGYACGHKDMFHCTPECFENALNESEIEFDINAKDPEDFGAIQQFVEGLIIYSFKTVYPLEIKGLLKDRPFRFIDTGRHAQLSVGEPDGEFPKKIEHWAYSAVVDSVPPRWEDALFTALLNLVPAPTVYGFKSYAVNIDENNKLIKTNEKEREYGWGNSPYEAYNMIQAAIHANLSKPPFNFKPQKVADYLHKARIQPDDYEVLGIDTAELPPNLNLDIHFPDSWMEAPNVVRIPEREE